MSYHIRQIAMADWPTVRDGITGPQRPATPWELLQMGLKHLGTDDATGMAYFDVGLLDAAAIAALPGRKVSWNHHAEPHKRHRMLPGHARAHAQKDGLPAHRWDGERTE